MRSKLQAFRTKDRGRDLLARREYSLQALMDMSQALAMSDDLYGTVDALLLNLMGQLRSGRACVWLIPEGGADTLVLVRSRGVDNAQARVVMAACGSRLMELFRDRPDPFPVDALSDEADAPIREFTGRAGLALFAPIHLRGQLLGIIALGPRPDAEPYADSDVRALQASLAIASVALENGRCHDRLLQSKRELGLVNERLEELDRLKMEFLGNINHELRTPLSIIIASIDCLARQEEEHSPGQEFLRYAGGQAQKLMEMIEKLLTLSEAARGSRRPDLGEGDLVAVVSAFYRERLPGVSSGLREFTYMQEANALNARFDEHQLKQLLDVFIENAVKFTPPGSEILLRVREVSLQGEPWARIDVEDNGPGIPSSQLPSLFESFRQADGSLTRAAGGMGIGLALARELADGLGGHLGVTSKEGKGSAFSVYLPAVVQFTAGSADDPVIRRGSIMGNELEILEAENRGRTAVLRIKGRLDVKTAPILLKRAAEIQANGQNLVLNLADVSFMGSSGIGALLVLVEQFQEQAGAMRLASPSPAVEAVIKLLNLDRFLPIDPSEDKALAELER